MQTQLFDHARFEDAEMYVNDPDWAMEQKLDGMRALIRINNETGIQFFTRGGRPLKSTQATPHFDRIRRDMQLLWMETYKHGGEFWIDGELMCNSGVYWAFDCVQAPKTNTTDHSYPEFPQARRRRVLRQLFSLHLAERGHVKLLRQAITKEDKQKLLTMVNHTGVEGVMVKRRGAQYEPGRRVRHSLKLKNVRTADLVVMARDGQGTGSHCNAMLGAYTGSEIKMVGHCSMIGKEDARPGDVVEVAYLYMTPYGILYQPRMMGMRPDKTPEDCGMGQFKTYSKEVLS